MKLWTDHPPTLHLDEPGLKLDWTKGGYWHDLRESFRIRYRVLLPELHRRLDENQFLWCWTYKPQMVRFTDKVSPPLNRWEIEISFADVFKWINSAAWDDLLYDRSNDWDSLFLDPKNEAEAVPNTDDPRILDKVTPIVRFPPNQIRCLGPIPAYYS